MRYGASFPIVAMDDTAAVRDLAQALDGAGFDFAGTAGHLLSAEQDRFPDRPAPTYAGPFYDPFVLFAYLSAVTQQLKFRTSILILPLFQTTVVAKQAAELAVLSGGRLELGVGISWNEAEYQAAGQDFHTRGRRLAEQIEVLRLLLTEPYVSYSGRWHEIDRLGLASRRPERPIPIWVGSTMEERPMRRAARLGDGWAPMGEPGPDVLDRLHGYLEEAERDPAGFGLTLRLTAGEGGASAWVEEGKRLQGVGATHITVAAPPDLQGQAALDRIIEARKVLAESIG